MPVILLVIGILLIVSAIKGTEHELGKLIQEDFTGSGSFLYWLAAIGVLGALGYVPALKTPSRYLIALIIVAMVFSNQGVLSKLLQAIQSPQAAASVAPPAGGGSSSSSNAGSSIGNAVSTGSSILNSIPVIGNLLGGLF
jgi:hypothetical protein